MSVCCVCVYIYAAAAAAAGASRGIGHATVKLFAAAGWRVITCVRTPFNAELSTQCPWAEGPAHHVTVDFSDAIDTYRAIQEIRRTAVSVKWTATMQTVVLYHFELTRIGHTF